MLRRMIGITLFALALAPDTVHAAEAPPVCQTQATALLDALARQDYAHADTGFDAAVTHALGPTGLQAMWTKLQRQFGRYRAHGAPQARTIAGQPTVATRVTFAKRDLEALVACDGDGQIKGFRLVPAPPARSTPRSGHIEPNGVREEPVTVKSPLGPLAGELVLPAGNGPFPAAVLVAGSGPHDMDVSIGPNKTFREIAMDLAAQGVASLRYDKRTYDYGFAVAGDAHFTIDQEVTDDALTALTVLAHQPHVDGERLFVIGRSLGAMLAPRIGERDPALAGLVMLAAPARPTLAVTAQQVREQGKLAGATDQQIARREQAVATERELLAHADPKHPPAGKYAHVPQSYWLSLQRYDQVKTAERLTMPMLFLQGGSDFQVSPVADFDRWRTLLRGHSNVAFHLYPGLSHLFTPAGKTGTIADYQAPQHIDATVIRDIATWIKAH